MDVQSVLLSASFLGVHECAMYVIRYHIKVFHLASRCTQFRVFTKTG